MLAFNNLKVGSLAKIVTTVSYSSRKKVVSSSDAMLDVLTNKVISNNDFKKESGGRFH